jgi:tRNA(Ile)-lysidine synthase TilS/MesJ
MAWVERSVVMPDEPLWEKIPPKEDETPEEIRRQRDLYRDMVDKWILEEWINLKPEDLVFDPNSQVEIDKIIAELEAGLPT